MRYERSYKHLNDDENKELCKLFDQIFWCSRGCRDTFPEIVDSDEFCEECKPRFARIEELADLGGRRLSGEDD